MYLLYLLLLYSATVDHTESEYQYMARCTLIEYYRYVGEIST